MENKPSGGRFIAALLFFATTAGIAILLLLTALVIWLSSVTGSFIASALIAGGFFAVLALLVYLFAIRDAVEQIRRQAETVYEVAHAAQTGYEWLAGKVSLFLKLREELQKNEKAGAASCSGFSGLPRRVAPPSPHGPSQNGPFELAPNCVSDFSGSCFGLT